MLASILVKKTVKQTPLSTLIVVTCWKVACFPRIWKQCWSNWTLRDLLFLFLLVVTYINLLVRASIQTAELKTSGVNVNAIKLTSALSVLLE